MSSDQRSRASGRSARTRRRPATHFDAGRRDQTHSSNPAYSSAAGAMSLLHLLVGSVELVVNRRALGRLLRVLLHGICPETGSPPLVRMRRPGRLGCGSPYLWERTWVFVPEIPANGLHCRLVFPKGGGVGFSSLLLPHRPSASYSLPPSERPCQLIPGFESRLSGSFSSFLCGFARGPRTTARLSRNSTGFLASSTTFARSPTARSPTLSGLWIRYSLDTV